jgi:hypothetical protein
MLYVILFKILMFYFVYICYIKRISTLFEFILPVYESKNEMDWACGAYGRGEGCAQGVGGEA